MCMAAGLSTGDWLRTYTLTRGAVESGDARVIHAAYRDAVWPWLQRALAADAYVRCSGRCFISLTVLEGGWPRNLLVSEFTSNQAQHIIS